MKALITSLAVSALFVAGCGDSSSSKSKSESKSDGGASSSKSGGAGKSPDESAFSIKYATDDGGTFIFTKNANGSQKRMDRIDSDGWHDVTVWDRNGGANKKGVVYVYEDGEWTDVPREDADGNVSMHAIRCEQTLNNAYSEVKDLTAYYTNEKIGFAKRAGQTVAGKSCDVYAGVYPDGMSLPRYSALYFKGSEEEIAVWNGLTMRLRYTRGADSKTVTTPLEAQAVTFSVPDSAFTKTLETSWIK
ncbi:MAG: hypothetical protein FWG05_01235 [Kiritimatiellaeota bacterium]|nr:hypothetical protein [Kiritimatiellota bacterium]